MWIQDVPGGGVNAVAYSPDGATLYTQDDGRWYTAWDLATHAGRRVLQYPVTVGPDGRAQTVTNSFPRMFVSPDGRFLVTNTTPALVWDLDAENLHAEVPKENSFAGVSMGVGRVRVECVSDDWLGVRSWYFDREEAGPEQRDWPVSGTTIKTHNYSPDGTRIALLCWNDTVLVCDVETRRLAFKIDSARRSLQHCRFAPDGRSLVLYMADGIAVWDSQSGTQRVDRVQCDRPYWMLAFHPTASLVAVRRKDGVLSLLSLETGEEVRAFDFHLGREATCSAFAPDGLTCAVGGPGEAGAESGGRFAVFDVDV